MSGRSSLRSRAARASIALLVALAAACSSSGGVSQETSRGIESSGPAGTSDTSDTSDDASDDAGDSSPDGDDRPPPRELLPFEPAPIEWEEYNDAVDVGTLEVPVDYADPDGPRFELFLARYRALDPDRRIGTLLVNPGGPGFPGSDWAFFAAQSFDRRLLERFDIIGWDPRGTGESDPPIDCIDDYDRFFTEPDHTPETEAERQAIVDTARELAQRCVENNRDIIEHVGTNNSARDIDVIRRALGEEQITYFGFSYGSELGGVWVTLFPDTVRAAVFDGASDPSADDLAFGLQQQRGFESALARFLARCSDDDECAFHHGGDAEGAFDALMLALDDEPIRGVTGRPLVNRDVALSAVVRAMYDDALWPALEESLADAEQGDGGGLLALHDSYYQRRADGSYGNGLEAFQAISCADEDERKSVEVEDAEAPLYTEAAPRMNPPGTIGYFCTFFPPSIDPRIEITGAGAGPILVIGTTGDPTTPFEATERMSDLLEDGRLVVVEANRHTGYVVNRCVIDIVSDYLIDLEPPADGVECR